MDLSIRQMRLPTSCFGRHPLRVPSPPAQRGADRVRTALQVCAVASDTSSRRRAKSSPGSSSTEVAAASSASFSSTDDPAVSSVDAPPDQPQTATSSLSILGSFDETYHNISDRVQEAEHAVEDAWKESLLGKGWKNYTSALATNPTRTKALTSFVGFVIGDIAAQKIGGGIGIDPIRCIRLGMYGLLVDGPFGHLWYKVLDKRVEPDNPNGMKAVLLKTAADQLIWAPIMTCVFFAVLKTLEGHPELVLSTIQDKLVKTIVANYVLWPAAHFINFRFVPSEHRILYNNCVSVAWNCYLSTLSHDAVLDTTQLLDVVDQAQGFLDGWLPADLADNLSKAGLEGLRFDIPRSVELRPTRTLLDWAASAIKETGPLP